MNTELLPFDVEAALAGADVVTVDGGTCTADLRNQASSRLFLGLGFCGK